MTASDAAVIATLPPGNYTALVSGNRGDTTGVAIVEVYDITDTTVDEYNATPATWFGVSAGNLATVLPNIGRFARPNLGFMG
jgi:uncharacterized protein (DUF1501 family)